MKTDHTREFLFSRSPRLGGFYTQNPRYLAAMVFLVSLVCLVIPAYLLGIHSIPSRNGNVGFCYRAWCPVFLVLFPVLAALFSYISGQMLRALKRLVDTRVIGTDDDRPLTNYIQDFSARIAKYDRIIFWSALAVAMLLSIADAYDLANGYIVCLIRGGKYTFQENDWSNAFNFRPAGILPVTGWKPPSILSNLAFVFLAYFLQGAAIFLSIFWVSTFWFYLHTFSALFRDRNSSYHFDPVENDPKQRLGLYPMGKLFNWFLGCAILFQVYVLWHRIEQVELRGNQSKGSYISMLIKTARSPSTQDLLNLNSDLYAFRTIDIGTWLLLLFSLLPIIIISYLPLWRIRNYVERRVDNLVDGFARLEKQEANQGRVTEAEQYAHRIALLDQSHLWPNNSMAYHLLFVMVILAIGAWLPPLLAYLAGAGLLVKAFTLVTKKRTGGRDGSDG